MIIAPNIAFIGNCGKDVPFVLANNNEAPVEQGVSFVASLRKCNLIVDHDYVERLSTLGFRNYVGTLLRSESLCERSTIPVTYPSLPLNDRKGLRQQERTDSPRHSAQRPRRTHGWKDF
jgi:hypothetical protein